jgi:hypothetical protein
MKSEDSSDRWWLTEVTYSLTASEPHCYPNIYSVLNLSEMEDEEAYGKINGGSFCSSTQDLQHRSPAFIMYTNYSLFSLLSLKRKVRLMKSPVCLSVCVCLSVPPNKFWTSWFMKFSREVMPLKVTSTPYFLIPYLQPFQNGARSNFWGGYKTCTSQRGTMTFCILIDLQRVNNF